MLAFKRERTLKCSFCGKAASEVGRLMGGPGVHICDACVGVCNKILEATPSSFATRWEDMTDEQLLGSLKSTEATVDATRAVLQAQIDELRRRGVSWEGIGGSLGISRQAAWERFS
ncbi:MAG: ClpX C4-type zinc finger protein [Xanthobacteraceae bacterium]